jgi:hypothetical protein
MRSTASGAREFSRMRRGGPETMEWRDIHADRLEELAQVHRFSIKKRQNNDEIDFHITVKEFASPPQGQHLRFFAVADREVNQKTAPFLPSGWGDTIGQALRDCIQLIRQFPYEGHEQE